MTLPRTDVVAGLQAQLEDFGAFVRAIDDARWHRATRCAGWDVADVAAHVVGSMADVTAGRFEGLGSPEVTQREVDERRGHSPAELADELLGVAKLTADIGAAIDDAAWIGTAPGGLDMSLGEGVEALWYDTYMHTLDMRAALGMPEVRGPALRASVSHVADVLTRQGWGPATLVLEGIEPFTVSGGGGQHIDGDPLAFVLVATGRADPTTFGLDETVNVYR